MMIASKVKDKKLVAASRGAPVGTASTCALTNAATAITTTISGTGSTLRIVADTQQRIDSVTVNLRPFYRSLLVKLALASQQNAMTICDFITVELNELNITDATREWKLKILCWLSMHLNNKPFEQMTKQDLLNYLGTLRKKDADDPTHKWIGTYNNRQIILSKFFRWLYNKDEADPRQRIMPPCMNGVKRLPRKERSSYKPSDIWTNEEHDVFLRYCPSKRDRCYHAMAYDTSARPHELLKLNICDIKFKLSPEGTQYALITVTGKTKTRALPLISSIPYVKDWLQDHPMSGNESAPLFVALSDQNYGQRINRDGLGRQYIEHYKKHYFPKLLDNVQVPLKDKAIIKNMLSKPWNLYIFRHSALTDKSQILKEHTLRDHAGWTMSSKMPPTYLHYFGTESSNSLLEAHGIIKQREKRNQLLQPKQCPNCTEPNKPDSRFCAKCKMVLSYDAYEGIAATEQNSKDMLAHVMDQLHAMQKMFDEIKQS